MALGDLDLPASVNLDSIKKDSSEDKSLLTLKHAPSHLLLKNFVKF